MRSSLEPGFAVHVYGTEMPILREKAEEVRAALQKIDGVQNPTINAAAMNPIVEVEVDLRGSPAGRHQARRRQARRREPGAGRHRRATCPNSRRSSKSWSAGQPTSGMISPASVSCSSTPPTADTSSWARSPAVRMVPNEVVIQHDATSRRIDVVADVSGRPLADIERDVEAAIKKIQFPVEYHAEIPTKYSELQAADTLVLWLGAASLLAYCFCSRQRSGVGSSPSPSSWPCRRRCPARPWPRGSLRRRSPGFHSPPLLRSWPSRPATRCCCQPGQTTSGDRAAIVPLGSGTHGGP